MENLRGVKWYGHSFALGILVNHVAVTLADDGKIRASPKYRADFASRESRELGY
jgi:hypothetical protein